MGHKKITGSFSTRGSGLKIKWTVLPIDCSDGLYETVSESFKIILCQLLSAQQIKGTVKVHKFFLGYFVLA